MEIYFSGALQSVSVYDEEDPQIVNASERGSHLKRKNANRYPIMFQTGFKVPTTYAHTGKKPSFLYLKSTAASNVQREKINNSVLQSCNLLVDFLESTVDYKPFL